MKSLKHIKQFNESEEISQIYHKIKDIDNNHLYELISKLDDNTIDKINKILFNISDNNFGF